MSFQPVFIQNKDLPCLPCLSLLPTLSLLQVKGPPEWNEFKISLLSSLPQQCGLKVLINDCWFGGSSLHEFDSSPDHRCVNLLSLVWIISCGRRPFTSPVLPGFGLRRVEPHTPITQSGIVIRNNWVWPQNSKHAIKEFHCVDVHCFFIHSSVLDI